jgi:hypothetical protein
MSGNWWISAGTEAHPTGTDAFWQVGRASLPADSWSPPDSRHEPLRDRSQGAEAAGHAGSGAPQSSGVIL